MADTKISALTALTGANVDTAADVLAIVDTSATATKKILVDELRNAIGPVLATEQATTSGTAINFTGIPSWVKRITVMLVGVSTNGTDAWWLQLGDSGGIETSGYATATNIIASGATGISTSAFVLNITPIAAAVCSGVIVLTLEDASDNTWVCAGQVSRTDDAASPTNCIVTGHKATSATLDRIRLTTSAGVNTFDAGAMNIMYE